MLSDAIDLESGTGAAGQVAHSETPYGSKLAHRTADPPILQLRLPNPTRKRPGKTDGSNPGQRGDGRWQVNRGGRPEEAILGLRQHSQGGSGQSLRDHGTAPGQPASQGPQEVSHQSGLCNR